MSAVEDPPLTVTQKGGTLTVAYDDLPWQGFLKWLDRKGRRRNALPGHAPATTGTSVSGPTDGADVTGTDSPTDRTTDKKVL